MIELDYNMDRVTLTKKSVENIKIITPRKIHKGQIKSIYTSLCQGKHFDSPIVVNKIGMKIRVIDGLHRINALGQFFEKFPDEKLPVYFATYSNLTEEQERQIYTKWNISITQSTDDFIHSYKDTIPMFKRLTKELPLSVYDTPGKMKIRDIITAYHASKTNPYTGGEGKTKLNTVYFLQNIIDKDVDEMKQVFFILQKAFNPNEKTDWNRLSPFKNIVFRALYYLVAKNLNNLGKEYVINRMKSVLTGRTLLDQFRRYYGRRASVDAYISFKRLLNDTTSDKKFE